MPGSRGVAEVRFPSMLFGWSRSLRSPTGHLLAALSSLCNKITFQFTLSRIVMDDFAVNDSQMVC